MAPINFAAIVAMGLLGAGDEAGKASPRTKLAVLVVFDQLRGDYLTRWESQFGAKGFRRLMKDGAWFQNCHYPYANTLTGPGHASLATGCSPDKHGIIMNEWYDRRARAEVYCATIERYEQVPAPPQNAKNSSAGAPAPDRLLVPTLADALKQATEGRGRVVSLSFKDRSAVLMGGRQPDCCLWFDGVTGRAVTSTYYRGGLPSWLVEFNRAHPVDRWFAKPWTRLRPELDYMSLSGPDDVDGEGSGTAQGRIFPHPLTGGRDQVSKEHFKALYTSPFGNELLLELTKAAIDAEALGSRATPDLLCVSFSSSDVVGHVWGPDSQEVFDTTLRADLIVEQLLAHLDARLGPGNYTVALTADHGICPLPEVMRRQGKDAGRVSPKSVAKAAEAHLAAAFRSRDGVRWIEAIQDNWIYLNRDDIEKNGQQTAHVEQTLAAWLKQRPETLAVFTRSQLLDPSNATGRPDDAFVDSVRRCFHSERSGDVVAILKPYFYFSNYLDGTTHGSPHAYDTHVPLLVLGPGIKAVARSDRTVPQATTVILARSLGISPPSAAAYSVPDGLFATP